MVGAAVTDPANEVQGQNQRNENQLAKELRALPRDASRELAQFSKLFSDETRLRIFHYLMQRNELNVRSLCELLGQSQPAVSHHLALLRMAGLIECRREGKHNFYHIVPTRLKDLVDTMFSVMSSEPERIQFKSFSIVRE